jgi:hypothetical protein
MRKTLTLVLFLALGILPINSQRVGHSFLNSVAIKEPNIVIRGAYLHRVEVWAVPSGTGITPDEFVLLGKATRISQPGNNERWIFLIPSCTDTRLTATEIFVRAYDPSGKPLGKRSLPYVGVSAVYDALCRAR